MAGRGHTLGMARMARVLQGVGVRVWVLVLVLHGALLEVLGWHVPGAVVLAKQYSNPQIFQAPYNKIK